jgi:lipoprotein signal peptidase
MTQRTTVAVAERSTTQSRVAAVGAERTGKLRQVFVVLTLLVAVVALDQAVKWWGWRHAPTAMINRGGSPLVPSTLDGWYADPVIGALLDLVDVCLLSAAACFLVLRQRSGIVLVPGAVMLAGWMSNLLDRLGLHYWTAPGSVRGAVDFIHLGRLIVNVADAFILVATPLFVLAVTATYLGGRTRTTTPAAFPVTRMTTRRPARALIRALAFTGAVGLAAAVGVGATNDGGLTSPSASARAAVQPLDAGWSTHHLT